MEERQEKQKEVTPEMILKMKDVISDIEELRDIIVKSRDTLILKVEELRDMVEDVDTGVIGIEEGCDVLMMGVRDLERSLPKEGEDDEEGEKPSVEETSNDQTEPDTVELNGSSTKVDSNEFVPTSFMKKQEIEILEREEEEEEKEEYEENDIMFGGIVFYDGPGRF